jgi:Xaa-Pro aminopeptidase
MLQKEKLNQAISLLKDFDVDLWITTGRETGMNNDPVLPFLSTIDYTALMAIIITKSGQVIALVGHNDEEGARQLKIYDEVKGYDTNFDIELPKIIKRFSPAKIALNYSDYDVAADGLSHGLFLRISKIIHSVQSGAEIVSAENIIGALRGRKTESEKQRMIKAINTTQKIYDDAKSFVKAGITEKQIYDFFQERMKYYGVSASWEPSQCPGVMVGTSSVVGHNAPTDIVVKKGDVITVDFGVRENGYCSDMQRVFYVLKEDETEAPDKINKALSAIQEGVRCAAKAMVPGTKVYDVDAAARNYIVAQGFPSWNYALGHEIGRFAHDGGLLLAPQWERYEKTMLEKVIEEGMMFTLEPGIITECGFVGQEEVAYVGKKGGMILSEQQQSVYLV